MKGMKMHITLLAITITNFLATIVGFCLIGNSVPMHMNINMIVDSLGSPWWAIFLPIIPILCSIGLLIESKIRGKDYKNKKYLSIIIYALCMFFIYINWLLFAFLSSNLQIGEKWKISFEICLGIPLGVLFMTMGNYMPVIKQNKTLGIKTKSTLSSEEIWTKTHRLCGILAVSSGFALIVFAIAAGLSKISWIFFGCLILAVIMSAIVPMIYARTLYNKSKKTQN